MRKTILTLSLLAIVPLAAQQQQAMDKQSAEKDPTNKVAGTGTLPAGWHLRFDDSRGGRPAPKPEDVKFITMGSGFHVTGGPAAIYFADKDTYTGNFTAKASFRQTKAPEHPEAYGLFLGGTNLTTPQQSYMYFLVRGTGEFYIAHRAGPDVHPITPWKSSDAIKKQDASGQTTNELGAQITADSLHFTVNGTRVQSFAKSGLHGFSTDGQVGLRVNHNLDVHVSAIAVTKN